MKTNLDKNKAQPRLRIELMAGNKSLGSYVTDAENKVIIGSAKLADFIVPAAGIAKIHAMVRVDSASDIRLYDLGSSAGTFFKGKKVVEERLDDGDAFRIGQLDVRVDILAAAGADAPEKTLFAQPSTGDAILHVAHLQSGRLLEIYNIGRNQKLLCGSHSNQIFLEQIALQSPFVSRQAKSALIQIPEGFHVELYENNKAVRAEEEGKNFKLLPSQKALLRHDNGQELQFFWRGSDKRIGRGRAEADSKKFQLALGASLAICLAIIASLSLFNKPSEVLEEATATKSSYLRFTTQAAPAGGAASEAASETNSAPAASKTAAVTNMISQLLNKKAASSDSPATAVGVSGKQSIRTSNGEFSQQNIAANIGTGGGVDAKAMGSALAQAGAGGAKGLGGFGKGGVGVGASAFGSVNGTGFSLNIGGDEAEAVGGLDKSLIAAVVQANIGQIKHCYERQLLVDANIFGKVVSQWTIDKDGLVPQASIKKTTLNSDPVEKCISAKIRNWQFPKPKGGGQVLVSYPFLFKSTN